MLPRVHHISSIPPARKASDSGATDELRPVADDGEILTAGQPSACGRRPALGPGTSPVGG